MMYTNAVSILLFSCICLSTLAQTPTIFEQNGKYGLKHGETILVKPKFNAIRPFQEGRAAFKKGAKWGFMDEKGVMVIKPKYTHLQDLSQGVAAATKDPSPNKDTWGFIDASGKLIIPFQYLQPAPFQHPLNLLKTTTNYDGHPVYNNKGALVMERATYLDYCDKSIYRVHAIHDNFKSDLTYINDQGKILTPWLEQAPLLDDTPRVARRSSDDLETLLDINLKQDCGWYKKIYPFQNGLAIFEQEHLKLGALDKDYKIVIQPTFRTLRFSEKVLLGESDFKGGEWIVDDKGNKLAGPFKITREFEDGLAIVDHAYFINEKGERVSQEFARIGFYHSNYTSAYVYKKGEPFYTYIDRKGQPICSWYPMVEAFSQPRPASYTGRSGPSASEKVGKAIGNTLKGMTGLFVASVFQGFGRRGGGTGYENHEWLYYCIGADFAENRALVAMPGKRDTIELDNSRIFVDDHASFGYIDTTGKLVIPMQYEMATTFRKGKAIVKKAGKFGMIDTQGKVITPFLYDEMGQYYQDRMKVRKDDKWGFVNEAGQEVIPCQFDTAEDFIRTTISVSQGAETFTIGLDGKRQ